MRSTKPMRPIRFTIPLLLLVVFGLLVPLQFAWAWNPVEGIAKYFAKGIVGALVGFAEVINWPIIAFLWIADFLVGMLTAFVSLLLWVTMQITMGGIPLIPHSGANDVVTIGWTFTRGLANIFFVIILAWVAFATILRIRQYEVKTFLPKILIIAVLINFIPVIAGVIIDVAQIITTYFISNSIGVIDQWLSRWAGVKLVADFLQTGGVGDFFDKLLAAPVNIVALPLAGIIFNLFSMFIFLFYALLFILRVVAIWILIILAPLCWLGYIIPTGRSWWKMWWNQFILWTIIGIPMSFFLYLAGHMMGQAIPNCEPQLAGFWKTFFLQVPSDLICTFLPYVASIMILMIGMAVSIALAPRGASGLIKGAQKTAKWATIAGGTAAGLAAARRYGGKMKESGEFLKAGLAGDMAKGIKPKPWQLGKWATKGAWAAASKMGPLATKGIGPLMEMAGTEATGWAAKEQEKKIKAAKAKDKDLPKETQLAHLVRELGFAKLLKPGAAEVALGKMEALDEKHNLGWAVEKLSDEQARQLARLINKTTPDKMDDLVRYRPGLIKDSEVGDIVKNAMVKDGFDDKDVKKLIATMDDSEVAGLKADATKRAALIEKAAFKKAVDALKDADIEGLTEDTLRNTDFQEMVVRFKPWSFDRKLIEEKGLDYGHKLQQTAQRVGIDLVAKTSPTFVRAPYTPAGELYLDPFSGIADRKVAGDAIKDAMKEIRPSTTAGVTEGIDDVVEDLKAI